MAGQSLSFQRDTALPPLGASRLAQPPAAPRSTVAGIGDPPGTSEQRLLTLGCPSRRTLWRTWQNFQLRMELLGSGRPMA